MLGHKNFADQSFFGWPARPSAISHQPDVSTRPPEYSNTQLAATRQNTATILARANAWSERPRRLTIKGPTIWPAPKAAVITPTASGAGAPPRRSPSLMPAMVMIMKVPPTHNAESNNVGTLIHNAVARTPPVSTHFARVHNCRGSSPRPSQPLAKVESAAAAPNIGQIRPNVAGSST